MPTGFYERKISPSKIIEGQSFEDLVALGGSELREEKNGDRYWWRECQCKCGKIKWIKEHRLIRQPMTKSCGCHANQVHSERMKHKARRFSANRKWRPLLEYSVAASNRLFRQYQYQAKIRNYVFLLSKEKWLELTKKDCYYCGEEPKQITTFKNVNGNYIYNGIDRLDNNVGYIEYNCVPCCGICNQMKMDLGHDVFLKYIEKIYKRLVENAR